MNKTSPFTDHDRNEKQLTLWDHLEPASRALFDNQSLTYKEAASYLRLSEGYLRQLKREGKIPYIKRGRSVRFLVSSLDRWNRESEIYERRQKKR